MSKVLYILGGGIGNIVQAMPAIKATASEGHLIDLLLYCNSTQDLSIFKTPFVNDIFQENNKHRPSEKPNKKYDYQISCMFTPNQRHAKTIIRPKVKLARHGPEAEHYCNGARQMNVRAPMGDAQINIGTKGPTPKHPDTIAIYPGSKTNWAMKRWDKYDALCEHFKHVTIVGQKSDIESHGKPTWIKRPWKWPKHAEFLMVPLQEMAFFLAKCQGFIGNDGGLAHVAAATGIPVYVLFGPSSIAKNKPYSRKVCAISRGLKCQPCQYKQGRPYFVAGKGTCPLNMQCLQGMSVNFVLNKINLPHT